MKITKIILQVELVKHLHCVFLDCVGNKSAHSETLSRLIGGFGHFQESTCEIASSGIFDEFFLKVHDKAKI